MEKGQFIGTFIDDAFSYKDMVKTEEKMSFRKRFRSLQKPTETHLRFLKRMNVNEKEYVI